MDMGSANSVCASNLCRSAALAEWSRSETRLNDRNNLPHPLDLPDRVAQTVALG